MQVCDALGRQLMQLEDLPLSISSVQGTAACLRYADPYPPRPLKVPQLKGQPDSVCMRTSETKASKFVAPIPGKWLALSLLYHMNQ